MSASISWVTVARKEFLRLRRDRTLWIILAVLAGFILVAALNGRSNVEAQKATADGLVTQQEESLASRHAMATEEEAQIAAGETVAFSSWGARSAWAVGRSQGIQLVIPPAPLVGFAVGQSDLTPASHFVSTAPPATQVPTSQPANPFNLLIGSIDLAFVVLYVLPLLLLVLSFDLLSADRDRGTLRLLLSGPISVNSLLIGRAATRGGVVLITTAVLLALALLITGGEVGRFGLFVLVTLLYGLFWMALAVLVNAFRGSSATNAVVLAGAWLVLVVLLPALVHTTTDALYPAPERATYVAAQRTATAEGLREGRAALARFFEAHPELADAPADDEPTFPMAASARDQAVADAIGPVEAEDRRQRTRRAAAVGVARFLSPTLLA